MVRLSSLIACVAIAGALPAQQGKFNGFAVDAQAVVRMATGVDYDGMFGIAADAHGHYWITTRRAEDAGEHMLIEFDSAGRYLASYPQPKAVQSSTEGLRDLAFDGGNRLYAGAGGPVVYLFDTDTKSWNGSRTLQLDDLMLGVRGLAMNPDGDGGRGSLFAVEGDSVIGEFDMQGNLLREITSVTKDATGLGFDHGPYGDGLWVWSQSGDLAGTAKPGSRLVGIHVDLATELPSGMQLIGDSIVTGGFAGGAEVIEHAGGICLLAMAQGDGEVHDQFVEIGARFHYGTGCGPDLSYRGGTPYAGNASFAVVGSGFDMTRSVSPGAAFLLVGLNDLAQPAWPGITCCSVLTTPIIAAIGPTPIDPTRGEVEFMLPVPKEVPSFAIYFQIVDFRELPLLLSDGGAVMVGR